MPLRIGIDLGGTKIEGIALDASREVARVRTHTPRGDYDETVAAIADLVDQLDPAGAALVGIGIPGTVASTGLVKNANSTWLIGRRFQHDVEVAVRRPVRVANDANCFTASEAADGAGSGAAVVFGVILGTGVGGGIVVNGRALSGANGIAGEWGHNPLPWMEPGETAGPPCYCGKRGCIETFLSGPGMSADHERATGAALPPVQIVEEAASDPAAEATLQRYERRLAAALASVINVLDPDVVVLGGGMSNIGRLYTTVPRLWGDFVFAAGGDVVRTKLVRAQHGDSSGVRGAAWLWTQRTS